MVVGCCYWALNRKNSYFNPNNKFLSIQSGCSGLLRMKFDVKAQTQFLICENARFWIFLSEIQCSSPKRGNDLLKKSHFWALSIKLRYLSPYFHKNTGRESLFQVPKIQNKPKQLKYPIEVGLAKQKSVHTTQKTFETIESTSKKGLFGPKQIFQFSKAQ